MYEAQDSYLGRSVALKSLDSGADQPPDEEAFVKEFLMSASVSHPNLVRVFDFGYDFDNHPFFTMELAEGEEISTSNLLTTEAGFLRLLSQICSALELLHHFGFHHNDLKPANIRVKDNEQGRSVKILDFGLTKEYDPSRVTELGGTVEYMAPELFRSGTPSPQSDIYGLGVVLYKLATGRLPFSCSDPLDVISGHVEMEVPPVEPIVPFFNGACTSVLHHMLGKAPDERPRSMAEVLGRFATALGFSTHEFRDESAVSYFDTAVLQFIRKSSLLKEALDGFGDQLRLASTDEHLASALFDFVRQNLQVKFINVRLENDGRSLTSAHASKITDLVRMAVGRKGGPPVLPDSYVVDLGNYGALDPRFGDIARIESDSVVVVALDRLLSREQDQDSVLETVANMCAGSTVISRFVLSDLERNGALVKKQDGFVVRTDLLETADGHQTALSELLAQIDFLEPDEMDALSRLAIFDHGFTFGMASVVVRRPDSEVARELDKFVDMRIIGMDGNIYRFRHQSLQRALYSRLELSKRRQYHMAAARYLADNEQFERILQAGVLGRHYLLGGDVEEGVKKAVEYQKLTADRGEFKQPESLLILCDDMLKSSDIRNERLESELLMSFGDLYKLQGKFEIALESYNRITELVDVEPRLLAETYKDLGDIYKSRHEFSRGIEALNHALEIYGRIGDQLEISHTLNNMGNIHWINSDYDLALENYRDALRIQEKLGVTKDIGSTLSNMGVAYFVKGSHDAAIDCFERSIELKKQINDKPEIARTYNNLAAAYQQMGQFGRALNYLNQSMAMNREIGAQKELMFNLENIAEVCIGLGKYRRAEEISIEGFGLARSHDDLPHQGIFSSLLGLLYAERGLYGRSLEFIDRSQAVAERITDRPFTAKTLLLKARNYISLNALEAAEKVLSEARRIISPIECSSQLIRLKLLETARDFMSGRGATGLIARLENIDRQAEENQFHLELCESLLLRLEILAQNGRVSTEAIERFDESTGADQHTVFRSSLHMHLGIAAAQDREYKEAISHFDQAEVMARAFEQRELLWRVNFHMGKVRMVQLEYEEAFLKLKQAGKSLREIAGNIGDKDLVQKYMSGREKLEFLEAVKQLTVKLA